MPKRRRPAAIKSTETTPSTWTCPQCTLENVNRLRRCGACETRRPLAAIRQSSTVKNIPSPMKRQSQQDGESGRVPEEEPSPKSKKSINDVDSLIDSTKVTPKAKMVEIETDPGTVSSETTPTLFAWLGARKRRRKTNKTAKQSEKQGYVTVRIRVNDSLAEFGALQAMVKLGQSCGVLCVPKSAETREVELPDNVNAEQKIPGDSLTLEIVADKSQVDEEKEEVSESNCTMTSESASKDIRNTCKSSEMSHLAASGSGKRDDSGVENTQQASFGCVDEGEGVDTKKVATTQQVETGSTQKFPSIWMHADRTSKGEGLGPENITVGATCEAPNKQVGFGSISTPRTAERLKSSSVHKKPRPHSTPKHWDFSYSQASLSQDQSSQGVGRDNGLSQVSISTNTPKCRDEKQGSVDSWQADNSNSPADDISRRAVDTARTDAATTERADDPISSISAMVKVVAPKIASEELERKAPSVYGRFMTAGIGKHLEVSPTDLSNAERLLNKPASASLFKGAQSSHGSKAGVQTASAQYNESSLMQGFRTAGVGKQIEVSESSLLKAESLLANRAVDDGGRQKANNFTSPEQPHLPNRVSLSATTRKPFRTSSTIDADKPQPAPETFGFKTAGKGCSVSVSDESIAKAEALFKKPSLLTRSNATLSMKPFASKSNGHADFTRRSVPQSSVRSFARASAENPLSTPTLLLTRPSRVSISNDGPKRTISGSLSSNASREVTPRSQVSGFQTAGSGVSVHISETALEKAETLLSRTEPKQPQSDVAPSSSTGGFQTAGSGLSIHVSEAALKNANSLLYRTDTEQAESVVGMSFATPAIRSRPPRVSFLPSGDVTNSRPPSKAFGFQTAGSNKRLQVSESDLVNAGNLLHETPSLARSTFSFTPSFSKMPPPRLSFNSTFSGVRGPERPEKRPSKDSQLLSGFTTGGGDNLMVSSSGVTLAETLFQENTSPGTEPPFLRESLREDLASRPSKQPFLSGLNRDCQPKAGDGAQASSSAPCFTTAGVGTKIEVSIDSLNRAGHFLSGQEGSIFSHVERQFPADRSGDPKKDQAAMEHSESVGCDPSSGQLQSLEDHTGLEPPADEYQRINSIGQNTDRGIDKTRDIVLRINSTNAAFLRFDTHSRRPSSLRKDNDLSGTYDWQTGLLSRGIELGTLPAKWIPNHSRWIIWKLASIERFFWSELEAPYLTLDRVLDQLEKRYRREVKGGSRSALRKILNCDVSANQMMILCVSQVLSALERDSRTCEVELTDGWYSIRAIFDPPLTLFLRSRKIRIGTKLMVSGARLLHCEDGVDPLDDQYDVQANCAPTLTVSANSTRLARWDTKMGFVSTHSGVPSTRGLLCVRKISDVLLEGGNIPMIEVIVKKRFPVLYREKSADPQSASAKTMHQARVLTEAEESRRVLEFDKRKQNLVERFEEEIEAECIKEVDSEAPEIWRKVVNHSSPEDIFMSLDSEEKQAVDAWRERRASLLRTRIMDEMNAKLEEFEADFQQSTPFLRVLVQTATFSERSEEVPCGEQAMITVWNPSEEQLETLQEDRQVRITNIGVRENRYDGLVQLSANRRTSFHLMRRDGSDNTKASPETNFLSVFQVHSLSKEKPYRNRADFLGVVLTVTSLSGSPGGLLVHLTDNSGLLLRVECKSERPILKVLVMQHSARKSVAEALQLATFRSLNVMDFDNSVGCAVAQFDDSSQISPTCRSRCGSRELAIRRWINSERGRRRLYKLACALDVGVPFARLSTDSITVGYISDFHVTSKGVFLDVDSVGYKIQVFKLPVALLRDLVEACGDGQSQVVFGLTQEKKASSLNSIQTVFRARDKPFRFKLRHLEEPDPDCPSCQYEIHEVKCVDNTALADLYSSCRAN